MNIIKSAAENFYLALDSYYASTNDEKLFASSFEDITLKLYACESITYLVQPVMDVVNSGNFLMLESIKRYLRAIAVYSGKKHLLSPCLEPTPLDPGLFEAMYAVNTLTPYCLK